MQGQIRTLRIAFEANYGVGLSENHAIIPWLMSYASARIRSFTVDTGGNAAHEICRGRIFHEFLPQFGECLVYLKLQSKRVKEKLGPIWESGIYLGINEPRQEIIMGAPSSAV